MPISDEELRRRTLVASGRYDELARLLQSVKLRKLLVALSKAGVEDATLDGEFAWHNEQLAAWLEDAHERAQRGDYEEVGVF